jgi:hypothetical protein
MTNLEAIYAECQTIISTFMASEIVLVRALEKIGLDPNAENVPDNNTEFNTAVLNLCSGFVHTLSIEGDVHINSDRDAIRRSIWWWARHWGLDPYDFIEPPSSIQDVSELW